MNRPGDFRTVIPSLTPSATPIVEYDTAVPHLYANALCRSDTKGEPPQMPRLSHQGGAEPTLCSIVNSV